LQVKFGDTSNQERLLQVLSQTDDQDRNKRRNIKRERKDNKRSNPKLLSEMERFFEANGIYNHSVLKIRSYLLEQLPEHQVPCLKIIRKIMKEQFNLKHMHHDKANIKYKDSKYNEKRIWISRLVA
jgi:hypothetical protein